MSQGSRVCPHCGGLNGIEEQVCYRCGKKLPGKVGSALGGVSKDLGGQEALMTKIFWGLSVLVFAACLAIDANPAALVRGFRDSTVLRFGELYGPLVLIEGEWFRLLSATFVHANVLHIVFNSGAVLYLGRFVEAEFGWARFAIVFVASAIGGFYLSLWWNPFVLVLGSSGGIFGLIGAMCAMFIVRRDPGLRAAVMPMLIYALIMTFIFPRVSVTAHLGGLAAGFAVGYLFELERRFRVRGLGPVMALLGGLALVASVGSILLANRSEVWKNQRAHEVMQEG